MKKVLRLFWAVLSIALAITLTQYQTFTALVNGEWVFITGVLENLSLWTNYINTIALWKYVVVAVALLVVVITLIVKILKKLFKKRVKKNKKSNLPSRPINTVSATPTNTSSTNTSSTKKFTRV